VRGHRRLVAGIVAGACLLATAATAEARDVTVTSFDGTKINAHFYPGKGANAQHPAPTILEGPGWSSPGDTSPNNQGSVEAPFGIVNIDVLINHGYNVVTWDPRGFGQSGGTVEVDDPRYEGRDVSALIDYVAKQPEAMHDRRCHRTPGGLDCRTLANNPRVGMTGGSYGGGIQLVSAAIDPRIDTIIPTIAWHSLLTSLFPEGSIKNGWGSILVALGIEGATLPGGVQDPASAPGRQDPHFYDTVVNGETTGKVPQSDLDWYASKGPGSLVNRIKIPTLFIQGTADTLFPLDEAVTNFDAVSNHRVVVRRPNGIPVRRHGRLVRRDVPAKMIWFCGGHGACFTGNVDQSYIDNRELAWFDRYLRNQKRVDTGPRFAWVADDGQLRTSGEYPLKPAGSLHASGSGTLPIVPGQGSGGMIFASEAPNALNLSIPGPTAAANVVGAPHLLLTYSGTGAPAGTFVYAQIVNPRNHLVLGNIATPIPIVLDGQPHTVSRTLEMVAARAPAGSGYTLQLTPSSTLYDIQRSAGVVNFSSVDVTLPLGNPAG
jgi:ABC-2 type transport system ATP-binding protein